MLLSVPSIWHTNPNFLFRITAKAYRQPQIRSPLDSPSNFSSRAPSRCESAMSDTRTISRARIWDFIFLAHFFLIFWKVKFIFRRVAFEDLLLSVPSIWLTNPIFLFRITAKAYRQPQIRSPLDSPSNFSSRAPSRCESAMSDTRTISRARIWDFIFLAHLFLIFWKVKFFSRHNSGYM